MTDVPFSPYLRIVNVICHCGHIASCMSSAIVVILPAVCRLPLWSYCQLYVVCHCGHIASCMSSVIVVILPAVCRLSLWSYCQLYVICHCGHIASCMNMIHVWVVQPFKCEYAVAVYLLNSAYWVFVLASLQVPDGSVVKTSTSGLYNIVSMVTILSLSLVERGVRRTCVQVVFKPEKLS